MLKGATINFYCLFDESHFSNICNVIMECIELNWLSKPMKKIRSSEAAILVLNWVKQFFQCIVKCCWYYFQYLVFQGWQQINECTHLETRNFTVWIKYLLLFHVCSKIIKTTKFVYFFTNKDLKDYFYSNIILKITFTSSDI